MLGLHTALEMHKALTTMEVSSVELLTHSFSRIDECEAQIGAFISFMDRELLLRQARSIDDRRARGEKVGLFAGVPIAIKDNIAMSGLRLTCASRMLEAYVPPYSATVVKRLQEAELLILGKTNMDEFGFGSSTENSAFHPTRNPRAVDRVPGGTSGGSAAAVAAGVVPWALGTDTGGSVRQPASLCGVVGLRPTYGRVSRYGLVAYASSMDQVGPIACSIDDTNALFSLIGGNDELDSTSLPNRGHNEVSSTSTAVRLGIPNEYLTEACQPAVVETVWRIADLAVELGWKVSTVNVPLTAYALSIYYIIASVEAASNLARFAGTIYGYHTPDAINWNELAVRTRTSGFGAEVKRRIMLGTYTASAGYADQFYNKACRARSALSAEYERTFEKVDLILSPVSPTTAWCLGERINDPMRMYLSDIYSVPASLAGIPAVVIPSGHDEDGLPIGLQLSARARSDNYLLRQAKHLETQLARAAAHS